MKSVEFHKLTYLMLLIIGLSKITICSSFNVKLYEPNPIKDGITTRVQVDGAIKKFSFIQEDDIKNFSEIENYFPKKRRITQDGRFCAKAFVSEQKTYFDCTMVKTPDGQVTNTEWCYVDSMYDDQRKWEYCIPILDYDRIRAANLGVLKELTKIINNLNTDVGQNISPAQKSLEDIKKVKQMQTTILERMSKLTKTIDRIYTNLAKLEKVKEQCTEQEKKVKDLLFQIDAKERETKAKEQAAEKDFALTLKTHNCKGLLLYENEEEGDGLMGFYYDNEYFKGDYKTQKSRELYFDWTDGEPLKGINPNNFSVVWRGWLYIPISDFYRFSILCDDGAELYIHDELLISHNTKSLVQNYKNSISLITNSSVSDMEEFNNNDDPYKSISKERYLIGNLKLKLEVRYIHSIHTSVSTNGQVYFKLSWQSREFTETVIPSLYLFSAYNFDPLKITEYNVEDAQLRRLHENDTAFMNSDRYIIQDIPHELINSPILKLKTRYNKDSFEVRTNEPTNVYVALLAHYSNPLPNNFENTGMSMSLLQLDKNQSKGSKRLIAKKSSRLVIYKRSFNKGLVQIKFNKFGINLKGIPMVVFFSFDSSATTPLICTGQEELITQSTGKYFHSCSASSEIYGYKCEDGLSSKMRDEEGGIWAANSDGLGAWISVKFKNIFRITRIEYRNRKNPIERNSMLEVLFSSGESQMIHLKNNDSISVHSVTSVRADGAKFTIRGVYGTKNNGGAINIYGVKCHQDSAEEDEEDNSGAITNSQMASTVSNLNTSNLKDNHSLDQIDPSLVTPLFTKEKTKPINLICFDSISNSSKFDRIKLTVNKQIQVKCPESCAMTEIAVYGSSIYTKDSGICKAAYHAQKISAAGGLVTLVIKAGTTNYKGGLSNGIKSEGKAFSPVSISFEMYEEEDIIILKPGGKVDIRVENQNKEWKWAPAIITKVLETNNGKFLNMILDGENSNKIELPYPNKERIKPCGEHVKDRDCKGSLRRPNKIQPLLIRFIPKTYQSTITERGYLSDNGQVFGVNGKSFGWSINMEKKIITRTGTSHAYLESFIMFPPSPNSKFCNKAQPELLCEPVSWRVKAGKGKFTVKLFVGDSNDDRIVDLTINGKSLAKNRLIPKNTLEVLEDVFETKNNIFELTSDCKGDCDKSISIVNAIEIIPKESNSEDSSIKSKEKMTSCGNAFTGGRCQKGPDVLHCLFDDPTYPSAKFCNGALALISIPHDYKCKDQFGKYKCVNKVYSDSSECKLNCAKECLNSKCIH